MQTTVIVYKQTIAIVQRRKEVSCPLYTNNQPFMRCASCRGRCPHRPGGMHRFYENLRRIRNFPMGRQSRRPLQRRFTFLVGADDSVRPQNIPVLWESTANSLLPSGPMWASAPTTSRVSAYEFAEDFRCFRASCRAERSPAYASTENPA